MRLVIRKSALLELAKGLNGDSFEKIKAEIIAHLKGLENQENEPELAKAAEQLNSDEYMFSHLEKSLSGEWIEKAGYGIGTVRTWRGKKYKKIAQGKWVRVYDKIDRGAKNAMTRLIHQAESIDTPEEMMRFVLANKQRFSDANGKPLDIVDRLNAVIDGKTYAGKKAEPSKIAKPSKVKKEKEAPKQTEQKVEKQYSFSLDDIKSGKKVKTVEEMENVIRQIGKEYGDSAKGESKLIDFMGYNLEGGMAGRLYDDFFKKHGDMNYRSLLNELNGKKVSEREKHGDFADEYANTEEEKSAKKNKASNASVFAPSDSADKLKTGQNVKFAYGGNTLSGEIIARGMKGVQVRDGDGNVYKVDYEKIIGTTAKKTSIMGKSAATDYILNADSIKAGWRGTDGMQPESCDTIEGLYKSVEAARGEFNRITDSITNKFKSMNPIVMKRATLKNEARIKEKLREDEKSYKDGCKKTGEQYIAGKEGYDENSDTYHCRTIRDCDGHTICMNSIADVANILKHLDKQPYAARIKNNFANPSPVGYSDINANIKLSNGVIVEMQINTTANMIAKERYGHSLYEVFRSVKGKTGYEELSYLMGEAQKSLYGLSNEYSKNGNFPVDEIPMGKDGKHNIFDSSYKHEPFAAAIRKSVNKAIPLFKKAKADGILTGKTAEHFEHLIEYIKQ